MNHHLSPPSWIELQSVIPLESDNPGVVSVRTLTTLSPDTLEREYSKFIVRLSPGRRGMTPRPYIAGWGTRTVA